MLGQIIAFNLGKFGIIKPAIVVRLAELPKVLMSINRDHETHSF